MSPLPVRSCQVQLLADQMTSKGPPAAGTPVAALLSRIPRRDDKPASMADQSSGSSEVVLHALGSTTATSSTETTTGDNHSLQSQSSRNEARPQETVILPRNRKRVRPSRAPHLDLDTDPAPSRLFPDSDVMGRQQTAEQFEFPSSMPGTPPSLSHSPGRPSDDVTMGQQTAEQFEFGLDFPFLMSRPQPLRSPSPRRPSDGPPTHFGRSSSSSDGWEVLQASPKAPPARRTRACAKMLVRAKLRCACCFLLRADCRQKAG